MSDFINNADIQWLVNYIFSSKEHRNFSSDEKNIVIRLVSKSKNKLTDEFIHYMKSLIDSKILYSIENEINIQNLYESVGMAVDFISKFCNSLVSKKGYKEKVDTFKAHLLYFYGFFKERIVDVSKLMDVVNKKFYAHNPNSDYKELLNASINTFDEKTKELQITYTNTINSLEKKFDNKYADLKEKVDAAKKDIEYSTKSFDGLIPSMLTSLGIFVTIIITVIALYISNILDKTGADFLFTQMKYGRYLLSGQITINTVFLLLYFISKLTGKSLNLSYRKYPEEDIQKLSFLRASIFINPLMWILNIAAVMGYILLFDFWIWRTYIWPNYSIWLGISSGQTNIFNFIFFVAIIVVITLGPIATLLKFYEHTEEKIKKIAKKREEDNNKAEIKDEEKEIKNESKDI